MRRTVAIALLALAGVAGCGYLGNNASNSGASGHAVVPNVNQSGGGDSWERFLLARSVDPFRIVAGPDGNMWFTDTGSNAIVQITMAGAVNSFPLNDASSPVDITVGPDKALWFTDEGLYIGRMTIGGVLTRYSLAQFGVYPQFIASGPDGNLWFTGKGCSTGCVGRITTSGVINVYSIGDSKLRPQGITAGPDGNIWFVDSGTDKIPGAIGRITPAGLVTLFTANPNGPRPEYIVEAGDHQLYYEDQSFHKSLVRVDAVNGAMTLVGHLKWFASNVVSVGLDSLWYLSDCRCPRSTVYRFSLRSGSNQIEDLSPYDSVVGQIALGPDDNVWIASVDRSIDVAVRQSMVVSPSSLILRPGEQAYVSVTETNYSKLFLAISGNPNVLTIFTQNPSTGQFDVRAVNVGTTTLTLQDNGGNQASIPVTVTAP